MPSADLPAARGRLVVQATPRLFVAGDVKKYLYSSTEGFEASGFTQTGAVAGFGWDDIMVVAVGSEFQVSARFVHRAGYNHSDNPIPDENSFFNVAAPAVIENHLTMGFGFQIGQGVDVHAAYYRAFEAEVSGPMWHPMMGEVPGSNVTSSIFEDSFVLEFSFHHH